MKYFSEHKNQLEEQLLQVKDELEGWKQNNARLERQQGMLGYKLVIIIFFILVFLGRRVMYITLLIYILSQLILSTFCI